ncbi:hypothetical protein SBF1_1880008 [Candidatus Desulfosporosinus infrequens]|uniref:Uncharacterized protein n=1 Tax=Candidatus Desulfosporosinus infrequens TaxID=2043169 RepID=A0A2U3KDS1_9FIRM|nr:hypothetical protein SBF1_1880008 [Candidatus Desulfosporosinus infrequens]
MEKTNEKSEVIDFTPSPFSMLSIDWQAVRIMSPEDKNIPNVILYIRYP